MDFLRETDKDIFLCLQETIGDFHHGIGGTQKAEYARFLYILSLAYDKAVYMTDDMVISPIISRPTLIDVQTLGLLA
jgi:hypothetical protein